jgi:uncharacterized protein YqjF (DUF2071 family)
MGQKVANVPVRPFLTAEWRHLLMVNFAVEPGLLDPHVPAGTCLDAHGGITYVSLVAFRFIDTRVFGLTIPGHHTFEEMNLRFYVRHERSTELRRGVVFLKELVPRRAIATIARALYNEPYVALPMRHHVSGAPPAVEYGWRANGEWSTLAARATGPGSIPAQGSREEFITEHYWGYTRQRDGSTLEYRVEHPRWNVWSAEVSPLPPLQRLYGNELAAALTQPASAFIAEGSRVAVHLGTRLQGTRRAR